MKYENARNLLPEPLLRQVQKYISGRVVYIPARERRQAWGAASGYRQMLRQRNAEIRARFTIGETIEQLSDRYGLSPESIKRIVYCRKESVVLEYQGTLSSAQIWAQQGRLEEWVHAYLLSDGHNKPFSDGLKIVDRSYLGPVRMPLSLFCRCTGPEDGMRFRIHPVIWERHVQELMGVIQREKDLPPLIVHYLIPEGKDEGGFELNDGNTRWEAYTKLGVQEAYVIVWITDRDEYEQFMERYGEYMK